MTNLISVVVIAVNIVTNYTTARVNEKFVHTESGGRVCATLCYDSEERTVESVETNVVLGAQIGSNLVTLGQIRVHSVSGLGMGASDGPNPGQAQVLQGYGEDDRLHELGSLPTDGR